MKKIFKILLLVVFGLSLVACSRDNNKYPADDNGLCAPVEPAC